MIDIGKELNYNNDTATWAEIKRSIKSMKILATNIPNLENDKKTLYLLTKKTATPISELHDDEYDIAWPVDGYLHYEDLNSDGEVIERLKILSGNRIFSTSGAPAIRTFFEIKDIMGDDPYSINFVERTSNKTKRTYYVCDLAI